MRLLTVPFSHFCEKARWGLERAGIFFVEEGHVPMLHWRATLGAGGGRSVPVLVTDAGVLRDSTDILRFADGRAPAERRLYPPELEAEVAALEDDFDKRLGPHARRIFYYHALPHRRLVLRLAAADVPRWETLVLGAAFPVVRALMRRGMRIDEAGEVRSRATVERIWSEVDTRLADGRRFLIGDSFTAADLTFAALGGPLVFPREFPRSLPEDVAPESLLALRDQLRHTPAGAFILQMYRDHRRCS